MSLFCLFIIEANYLMHHYVSKYLFLKQHWLKYMGTDKLAYVVVLPGVTRPEDVLARTRKWSRTHAQSSTKCTDHAWPEVACQMWRQQRSRDPEEIPWNGEVCACATESCAISALNGPFHEMMSPVGLPLEWLDARVRDRMCPIMNLFSTKEDWNVL